MGLIHIDDVQSANITIGVGGQTFEYAYEFPVLFDTNQWYVQDFIVTLNASQSYTPQVTGVVQGGISANYDGRTGTAGISWGLVDASQSKQVFANVTGLNYSVTNDKMKVRVSYKLPTVAISTQVMSFTATVSMGFNSKVAVPTDQPRFGEKVVTQTGQPEPFKWPWESWDLTTKLLVAGGAVTALVLIIRPSAPATIISSGIRQYRSSRK